jgi:two-component system LytT family response regulator
MQLTALIVDDEPLAREGLRLLLCQDPEVSGIREAKNGRDAVEAICGSRPDLVFLDVQMPGMDGFSVLQKVGPERMPPVVFVTAHDRYAIRAFEINAIDYLLKPVSAARFGQSLERAKARLGVTEGAGRQIISLLETVASSSRYVKRLAVRSSSKTRFVTVADIDWIQAAENYAELHTGSSSHLLTATMSTLEKSLDPALFQRIHRSIIVNLSRIKEIQLGLHGEYVIALESGVQLHSGRTYHEKIKSLMANPF